MPVNDLGDEAAAAIFVGKDFVFRSKVVIWSQILSSLSPKSYCLLKVGAGNRFPQQRPAAATLGQPTRWKPTRKLFYRCVWTTMRKTVSVINLPSLNLLPLT